MAINPWCFDPDTQKLGDLPAAAEAYKQEIELAHTQFSDDGGWERLMVKIYFVTKRKPS